MGAVGWGEPIRAGDPGAMGPYRLLSVLGEGGMGRVYLGRSPGGRLVAVKVIRPSLAHEDGFRARFRREAEAARRVGGAFTAAVLAVADADDPQPWIAAEYVPAPGLDQVLAGCGPMPVLAARWIAAGIAEGLGAVHTAGIVHRDVKPSNVLLTDAGPMLIDFGIARETAPGQGLTGATTVVGTPGYLAPELLTEPPAEPTAATDVFALGALLYTVVTGKAPFGDGPAFQVMYRTAYEQPDFAPVPPELRGLVSACLLKTPGDRPGIGDILDDFAPHLAALPAAHRSSDVLPPQVVELLRRHRDPNQTPEAAPAPAPAPAAASTPAPASGARAGAAAGAAPRAPSATPPIPERAPWAAPAPPVVPPPPPRPAFAPMAGRTDAEPAPPVPTYPRIPPPPPTAIRSELRQDPGTPPADSRYTADELREQLAGLWQEVDSLPAPQSRERFAELASHYTDVLGPDDPETLQVRYTHALFTDRSGDHVVAYRLFTGLIPALDAGLGGDHQATLLAREKQATLALRAADHEAALTLFDGLARDLAALRGPTHPATFSARHQYAVVLGHLGRTSTAVHHLAVLADEAAQVLGAAHPLVRTFRNDEARLRGPEEPDDPDEVDYWVYR
ncbi:serine/threonine-protein kinase [Yinghuangia soli]|uniref:Serine/threonine-protein kinase n=1 Tax=Yinghuangia soli TaxID=2908204 RepID=A0AA41PXA5_9ACTN|nr:serine/threonine-protein kinase [Yinghuangia soli]MCF2527060.1 serine/threonine-protein kinase [Yinghuangia soli]